MKRHNAFLLLVIALWLCSCTAPKNVAYFQDAELIRGMSLQEDQPLRLRPNDKINIMVNSADPLLTRQFNLITNSSSNRSLGATSSPQMSSGNVSGGNGLMLAYTVDEQGDIDFPVLGKVAVKGMTRQEVAAYLRERLISRDLVRDPIVTVEYVNLCVKVLGEVNKPGRIDILRDNYTILDAITDAGDLTINGQREHIMVMREVDGEDQTFIINLCDRQSILTSPAYYLQQNDVVYVTPTNRRMREARTIGNTFNQPAIWISLASLLTTITLIFIR
jgi:polysaccharide export outer membrane protein